MAYTEQSLIFCGDSTVPAASPLDVSSVICVRFPVTQRLPIIEFGVRVVSSTATGTTFVLTLKGEPVAGATPVTLSTLTGTTNITQGQCGKRYVEAVVQPDTYAFVTLTALNGAGSCTGIPYFIYRTAGQFTTETNDVIFTA